MAINREIAVVIQVAYALLTAYFSFHSTFHQYPTLLKLSFFSSDFLCLTLLVGVLMSVCWTTLKSAIVTLIV